MPEPGQFGKAEASVASGSIGPNSGVSASDVLGGAGRPDRSEPGQRANLASAQYFAEQGITATNPYGKQGFFSKHFGIDPANISYANIMSPTQMAGIAALSYDRYQNPYAATNVLGKATGAQPAFGVVRSGLKPGDITRLGTVQAYRQNLGLLDRLAAGVGTLAIPGAGYAIDKGTQVMGLEDSAPIDPNTGMSLSPTSGGIMDVLTGGQAGFIGEKTGNMVDSMMNFFSGEQQPTDIPSQDTTAVSDLLSSYNFSGNQQPADIQPIDVAPQLSFVPTMSPEELENRMEFIRSMK